MSSETGGDVSSSRFICIIFRCSMGIRCTRANWPSAPVMGADGREDALNGRCTGAV
ncbi:MAG: hypothetical protein GX358_09955 [candidate division WS1 bacterium]|nr:hypothetical protein [candidate division WS1 bacterium]